MRFQKPIELWGNEEKLRKGELVLQRGQHVLVGGAKARYIGINGHSIWVSYQGQTEKFKILCRAMRGARPASQAV